MRPYRDDEEDMARAILHRLTEAATELMAGYPDEAAGIIAEVAGRIDELIIQMKEFDNGRA
jgi:hypothetical protein